VTRAKLALPWLGLLLSVAFSYLAIRNVDPTEAWDALRSSNLWWLVPAFLAWAVAVSMRAVRWRFLFRPENRPPLSSITSALFVGYFFNSVLPARSGEAARVLALHRSSGNSRAETAATVVVERVFDVVSLVVILFAASPWLPDVSWAGSAAILAAGLGAACVLLLVAVTLWGERPFRLLLRPLALLPFFAEERLAGAAFSLVHGLAAIRRPRLTVIAFFWTTLSWLGLALSTWFVLQAFHLDLPFLAGLLVVIAINLAMVLPSGPSAVGVWEAATLVALSAYGVPQSQALPAALVLHLLNLVPCLVAGAFVVHAVSRRSPQPELTTARAGPGAGGRAGR